MKCQYCNKEHDGSYGSGKFCSMSCRNKSNRAIQKTPYANLSRDELRKHNIATGKWKCPYCGEHCASRKLLSLHKEENHKDILEKQNGGWNKGLTKETNASIKKGVETYRERVKSGEIIPSFKGRKHSEDVKRRLSENKRQYYKDNPDKIPFRVWHYSKGESYPEKYFREWLEKEGIPFQKEYAFGLYSLDFLIGNINLEIDGDQHYRTQKAIDKDLRRNKELEDNGFKVIRIRWSYFQRFTKEEKFLYLSELKKTLLGAGSLPEHFIISEKDGGIRTKFIIHNPEIKGYCKHCGKPIINNNKVYCSIQCAKSDKMLKNVPTKEQLLKDYETMGTAEIARKYGVRWQQIGKWRKKYDIPTPPRGKKR